MTENMFEAMQGEFDNLKRQNEVLEESLNDLIAKANDAFWKPVNFVQQEGVQLDELKQLSLRLREQEATGSLHTRAVQLMHAYVFGRGMLINKEDLVPRVRKAIEHPYNKAAVFGPKAKEELVRAMYTDGQVFILRGTGDRVLTRVPIAEVAGFNVDENSPERVWHIKRTWFNGTKHISKWYPTNDYMLATTPSTRAKSIINEAGKRETVDNTKVLHFTSAGKQIGWAFGLPIGLPAMQWVETYTRFIQNSASLVESYNKIAFKFSQKASQAPATAAAIASAPAQVGGVASMGLADSLTAMPAIGSQVSFQNGRPIAALAASAVGVSVVALLSDPGAAGSSYGAAQTLDLPTIRVMSGWQDVWVEFFRELILGLGATEETLEVSFPSIETDVPYRQITSLSQAYQMGGLHQEEYRGSLLSVLDIPNARPVDDLPEPDQFNAAHPIPFESDEDEAETNKPEPSDEPVNDPLARQGNSGAVGSVEPDSNFNRQADNGRV